MNFGSFAAAALMCGCIGCATITESVRNDDQPVRSYVEASKTAEWTYTVHASGTAEGLALHVGRSHACSDSTHDVADRTAVTERHWDSTKPNGRASLYFWGGVGLVASVIGGTYLLSRASSDGDRATASVVLTGGSVASIMLPIGNEFRAIDSSEHVGMVDYVDHREARQCDVEPAPDITVDVIGSDGGVVATVKADDSGRAAVPLSTEDVLRTGPHPSFRVAGLYVGSTDAPAERYRGAALQEDARRDALTERYQAVMRDEEAWKGSKADLCGNPTDEHACAGVEAYVKAFPSGTHIEVARDLLARAEGALAEMRRRREAEATLTERLTERAGVALGNVRLRVDDPSLGTPSATRYLIATVDATATRGQPRLTMVWARASCLVDDKRMVDTTAGMADDLGDLSAGETKEVRLPLFIGNPLVREPSQCEVLFGVQHVSGQTTAIRAVCYVPHVRAKYGPCNWPSTIKQ